MILKLLFGIFLTKRYEEDWVWGQNPLKNENDYEEYEKKDKDK